MENGTKLRILYLYQHPVQHTDAAHTLSTWHNNGMVEMKQAT